jgi:hypothetical protein
MNNMPKGRQIGADIDAKTRKQIAATRDRNIMKNMCKPNVQLTKKAPKWR